MAEAKQLKQLKKLWTKRNNLSAKVQSIDEQINSLMADIKVKSSIEKKDYPKPGSGPYKLCKVMSSRPKTKEEIAKKTGLSVNTVTLYLQQYNCFDSAGRGKGYIYKKPQ